MAKTRVYELAQKLGLDNKVLLERLHQAGIEAKSHMSVLEDDEVRKLETSVEPVAAGASEEKVEERVVRPGLIRRRRREIPKAVEEAEAPAEEVAEAPQAAEPEKVPVETETAPLPEKVVETPTSEPEARPEVKVEEPEVKGETAPEPSAAPPEPKIEEEADLPKEEAVEPAAVEKPKVDKVTPSRAKILGRVELPKPRVATPRGGRPAAGGEAGAPGRRDAGKRPGRPAPAPRTGRPGPGGPMIAPGPASAEIPGKDTRGRKKGKKGKSEAPRDVEQARRKGRREVFEPDRTDRYRKMRRGAKPAKKTEVTVSKAIKRIIRISDAISVGELAKRMGVKANDLIRELMRQGTMVTINHPLDFDTAALLATEFKYEVENVAFDEETILEHASLKGGSEEEKPEDLQERPPVVTIMGHVDHGKTSLLDAIRATNVTEGEAGGITQHIGAYDVELEGKKISFLDTPGHEAFTSMRARGAQVTDIVILVVAADDGVMPQTKEAINHAKAAGVPIIVAVNKIDKPGANPERVKQELTEFELVPEDWGGETIFCEVSAKENINIDSVLEMILLQAEVMELKANPNKRAKGAIVEARLDKGRGPVVTILVQEGTLRIGDPIVSGVHFGRARTMTDDRGNRVEEAGPSMPVEVTGLSGVPDAGDTFHAVDDEKIAKEVAGHRQQKLREAELAKTSKISLEQLYAKIQEGEAMELKAIIKGDVQGSVEAVKESLTKLSTPACRLVVIHTGVGGITESDISLASASDAIVLGFNVRPEPKASALADVEGVDIRMYNIIYDAVADIRDAMEGLLAPTLKENALGRVEVRETFSVSKIGTIAGCYVLDGKVLRNAQARLVRDNVVVWEGKMDSLKRFKDDVREVAAGYECGIGLENYNDIKVGDIIEVFEMEEVKTTL
ncbi:translation initiation factor IF-2 [uncultured Desulfuromonas sp.]|mgnify:CR=1 FL=1|uniref:translation initiation factor IF-2 n=1 Tax=uncultured Desulfuromonas sp. TaxID=181013 RepID=UPI0026107C31|nr:translation initiation factor IF-2 [uncultured Desulfuromonas sp.]